jgi:hypothetical protein
MAPHPPKYAYLGTPIARIEGLSSAWTRRNCGAKCGLPLRGDTTRFGIIDGVPRSFTSLISRKFAYRISGRATLLTPRFWGVRLRRHLQRRLAFLRASQPTHVGSPDGFQRLL